MASPELDLPLPWNRPNRVRHLVQISGIPPPPCPLALRSSLWPQSESMKCSILAAQLFGELSEICFRIFFLHLRPTVCELAAHPLHWDSAFIVLQLEPKQILLSMLKHYHPSLIVESKKIYDTGGGHLAHWLCAAQKRVMQPDPTSRHWILQLTALHVHIWGLWWGHLFLPRPLRSHYEEFISLELHSLLNHLDYKNTFVRMLFNGNSSALTL